jgi:threonine/homoserine/homoserine lactone efflux protein
MSAGAFLGISVAAPVGPMGILCIKRTLAHGMGIGISTGAGATTVQLCYCTLLLLGLDQIEPFLTSYRQSLSLAGACLMLAFAWRLLRADRPGQPTTFARARSAIFAYATGVALNCANPMSVVLLTAGVTSIFGPAPPSRTETVWVLLGLVVGSLGWWIGLTGVTAILGSRLSTRKLAVINRLTATALAGFGLVTIVRVLAH